MTPLDYSALLLLALLVPWLRVPSFRVRHFHRSRAAMGALLQFAGVPLGFQSIPKSARGYYVWSNATTIGADYSPATVFTATNCDNDKSGLNQMLSDMQANGVVKAYFFIQGASPVVNPAATPLLFGNSAIQLQANFPYDLESWNDPTQTGSRIRAGTNVATISGRTDAGTGAGATTVPSSADLIGITPYVYYTVAAPTTLAILPLGATAPTATLGVRMTNMFFADGGKAIWNVANFQNYGNNLVVETATYWKIWNCQFQGNVAATGHGLIMDGNEAAMVAGNTIIGGGPGKGFSWVCAAGSTDCENVAVVGASQAWVFAGLTCRFRSCILPGGETGPTVNGMTHANTNLAANVTQLPVNPFNQGVLNDSEYIFDGCVINNIASDWFLNAMGGDVLSQGVGTVTIFLRGGNYNLSDGGANNHNLIAAPTGGPVTLKAGSRFGCKGGATGCQISADSTTVYIDEGTSSYDSNVTHPIAQLLFPFSAAPLCVSSPRNPASTVSTASFVMAGLANPGAANRFAFTPRTTGRIQLYIFGKAKNATAGDGGSVKIAYNSTAPPANGAVASGTVTGATVTITSAAAGDYHGFNCVSAVITGLAVGTLYWFDLQFEAVTGGTFSLWNVQGEAYELQI